MTEKENQGDLSIPEQLSLFETDKDKNGNKFSNTVEIYDALPKFFWDSPREKMPSQSPIRNRQCKLGGVNLTIEVTPAYIKRDNDTTVMIYPGEREEIVDDALRRLAAKGNITQIDDKSGVKFSLYELAKELASTGNSLNLTQIKESLLVMNQSNLKCTNSSGERLFATSLYPMISLVTLSEIRENKNQKCYVQFHPLVHKSIIELSFRQFNYTTNTRMKSPLARWIFKRMSQYWTQASDKNPYTFKIKSFLLQTSRGLSANLAEDKRLVERALQLLVKNGVIREYEPPLKIKEGKKVLDFHYTLFPTPEFITEVITSNKKQNLDKLRLKHPKVIALKKN